MSARLLALDGETLVQDGGSGATRDVYYVNAPRNIAKDDPDLPRKGDPHPDDPTLFADAITARPAPDGNSHVTVLYSNDGRFGSGDQADDGLGDGQFSWSVTFTNVDQTIPVIKRVQKRFPKADGSLSEPIEVWEVGQITIPEPRPINALSANAEFVLSGGVPSSLPQFTNISDQAGKLHLIGTRRYAFVPKNVDQRNPEKWAVRYEWMQDNGTLLANFPGYDPSSALTSVFQGGPGAWVGDDNVKIPFYDEGSNPVEYVRPPYRFIQVIPAPIDPSAPYDPPGLPILKFPYAFDPSDEGGWVTLPGVL